MHQAANARRKFTECQLVGLYRVFTVDEVRTSILAVFEKYGYPPPIHVIEDGDYPTGLGEIARRKHIHLIRSEPSKEVRLQWRRTFWRNDLIPKMTREALLRTLAIDLSLNDREIGYRILRELQGTMSL